ncbi:bifunctional biotin--[acetyl-CoA-carboxylase] ligase/biotin operon repressor BirA [Metapseudomonas lalkuanensis]|uniref:Bifunctional ligase/repressor BirA n=1 Tax=Metapseudomonas lalkuanensis TaxID=2604832 RepID=A0A5J6QEB7_9GAMM|nr:bifunctional biotin--[acetyl-CoA-carboxylase] ligase/biotin operon repressor BirA [Pseudomonas lalkuanensis]QEY61024.1 bifunctional biotin--[acetyl-CoA-carboxylase] ligase/biotin operon repressor BirA [Pseudomonas lalkuanensis]UCO98760.1 bifunctional biotin--[acetyl-CoA-carboxylase] ligase/biotin operon repressor BirA [Pseudomonas lalkuanensis]
MLTLLKLLQDGCFHSGQALGDALGVSRSAVWKQLQQLEADLGLPIYKVRGRGYRLQSPLSLLDRSILEREGCPWSHQIFNSLDSTNAETMRRLGAGAVPPFAVIAERQTEGRGRRGRRWVSPYAQNLYYSLALRVDGGARQLEGLSLVVGLAVLKTLRSFGLAEAGLKWPNDLLVGNRKIAGILLELLGDPADICHVVVGIGVNVNMQLATEDIDQPWTSMRTETGVLVDRNALVARLNEHLEDYLGRHKREGFAALRAEWEGAHLWQGRLVNLTAGTQSIQGRVMGIDATGALRLSVDGEERAYSGGELSLRLSDDS